MFQPFVRLSRWSANFAASDRKMVSNGRNSVGWDVCSRCLADYSVKRFHSAEDVRPFTNVCKHGFGLFSKTVLVCSGKIGECLPFSCTEVNRFLQCDDDDGNVVRT